MAAHPQPDVDVVILGGGPAGTILAALLRREAPERSVRVLEREVFPRHHVGEACLPRWGPILARAGLLEALDRELPVRKAGVIFNWGPAGASDSWTADFREQALGRPALSSWHVDRADFDHRLLRHARALGADVREGARVRGVEALGVPGGGAPAEGDAPAGFRVAWDEAGEAREAIAATVVDATGQARLLARAWDLPVHRHEDMNNYAVYGYFSEGRLAESGWPLGEGERWAVIGTCDVGWAWHIPVRPGVASVGVVTDRETLRRASGQDDLEGFYRRALASCDEVAPLLEGAAFLGPSPEPDPAAGGPVRVVSDWSYRVERMCGPGWFLAGDAAMFVDPILASGLNLATGASSMVANALLTLWREPGTDAALLRRSYGETYRELAESFHRMARVWYRRNLRRETWHWQARQERLRAGGLSIYEEDADAFTALCLGAVASPLDAAVRPGSKDLWATEFFAWVTARRFFPDGDGAGAAPWEQAPDADAARDAGRHALLARWRRLVRSRLRLEDPRWAVRERYYTNEFMDRWELVRYLELEVPVDREGATTRVVFPTFDDHPAGLLPHLDGARPLGEVVRELVAAHPVGSEAREARVKAFAEMALQLDMMGRLAAEEAAPEPRLTGHPAVAGLLGAVLASLDGPCEVRFEMDWLGERCTVRVDEGGAPRWLRLYDARHASPGVRQQATDATVLYFHGRLDEDPAAARWVARLAARLARAERRAGPGEPPVWDAARELAGLVLAFAHRPGEQPVARAV